MRISLTGGSGCLREDGAGSQMGPGSPDLHPRRVLSYGTRGSQSRFLFFVLLLA